MPTPVLAGGADLSKQQTKQQQLIKRRRAQSQGSIKASSGSGSGSGPIRLDEEFVRRLARLLKLLVPSCRTVR
jgi:hypothetical protein